MTSGINEANRYRIESRPIPPAPDPQGGELDELLTRINHVAAESLGRIFGTADKERIATLIRNWLPAPAASPPPAAAVTGELPSGTGLERDAARWRALMSCDRIRVIGSSKLGTPHAHIGVEFWGKYPDAPPIGEDFLRFVDGLAPVPVQPQAEASEIERLRFQIACDEERAHNRGFLNIASPTALYEAALTETEVKAAALRQRCESAEAERDRVKEALAFYANPESYDSDHSPGSYVGSPSGRDLWKVDGGTIARKALEFKHEQR